MAPKLLEVVYRLQEQLEGLDADARRLLMFANLLEGHYAVREPRSRLTFEEYAKIPGRWAIVGDRACALRFGTAPWRSRHS